MKRILSTLVVTGVALSSAAHATTMTTATQTITFGPGLTEFTNATKQLQLFDSTLGTLDSVTIGAAYGFTSILTIGNTASGSSNGNARTESAAGFTAPVSGIDGVLQSLLGASGPTTVGGIVLTSSAFDILGAKANYSLASGASMNAASNATTQIIAPQTDSTASDLMAFEESGGGLFDVLFNTATATVLQNSGGNTSASEVTTANGSLNLYYTYDVAPPPPPPSPTPAPEPASIAVLGVGLLGAGAFRRFRR